MSDSENDVNEAAQENDIRPAKVAKKAKKGKKAKARPRQIVQDQKVEEPELDDQNTQNNTLQQQDKTEEQKQSISPFDPVIPENVPEIAEIQQQTFTEDLNLIAIAPPVEKPISNQKDDQTLLQVNAIANQLNDQEKINEIKEEIDQIQQEEQKRRENESKLEAEKEQQRLEEELQKKEQEQIKLQNELEEQRKQQLSFEEELRKQFELEMLKEQEEEERMRRERLEAQELFRKKQADLEKIRQEEIKHQEQIKSQEELKARQQYEERKRRVEEEARIKLEQQKQKQIEQLKKQQEQVEKEKEIRKQQQQQQEEAEKLQKQRIKEVEKRKQEILEQKRLEREKQLQKILEQNDSNKQQLSLLKSHQREQQIERLERSRQIKGAADQQTKEIKQIHRDHLVKLQNSLLKEEEKVFGNDEDLLIDLICLDEQQYTNIEIQLRETELLKTKLLLNNVNKWAKMSDIQLDEVKTPNIRSSNKTSQFKFHDHQLTAKHDDKAQSVANQQKIEKQDRKIDSQTICSCERTISVNDDYYLIRRTAREKQKLKDSQSTKSQQLPRNHFEMSNMRKLLEQHQNKVQRKIQEVEFALSQINVDKAYQD